MATQKKIDTVTALTEKISKAKSVVLADYRGLKHKQLEELRKALKKLDAQFVVTKNTLLSRAFGDKSSSLSLTEATATLFSFSDEITPLKELMKFFKNAGTGKTKGGLLGTQVLSDADVAHLAALPARDVLLAQLAAQLHAPVQSLHRALSWNINTFVWGLNEVKKKKG